MAVEPEPRGPEERAVDRRERRASERHGSIAHGAPALGWRLLLLAGILLFAAWLRHVGPSEAADLLPRPDAIEYEEAARNLAGGRGYALELAGSRWTPRYPPGFSALLAASTPVAGVEPGFGTWIVQAAGLATVLAAWWLASRAAGPWAGAVAALVVAVSRLHVGWSRLVMSDVPSSAACGLVAAWFLAALSRPSRTGETLALGAAAGALALLRPANLLLAVAMLATLALRGMFATRSAVGNPSPSSPPGHRADRAGLARIESRSETATRAAWLAAGIALGLAPLALYQWSRFGSPIASGYDEHLARVVPFSLDVALSRPGMRGTEPNLPYYLRTLAGLGWGTLYAWPIGVLVALGAAAGLRSGAPEARALVLFAASFVAATLVLFVPFFWQWDRFLLPLLPLLAAVAALGVVSPSSGRASRAGLVLLALGLLLNATREGAIRSSPLSQTIVGEADELHRVDEAVEPDAVVIMRADPLLEQRILGPIQSSASDEQRHRERRLVGIGASEHEPHVARPPDGSAAGGWLERPIVAPFDRRAFAARIGRLLEEGRPVYLVESPRDREVGFVGELRAAAREEFAATPVARHGDFVLLRLRAAPSAGGEPAAAP
ncbi:MAG: glycosyltransferase family 39 protein [Alphaproteobacteria bacterium]